MAEPNKTTVVTQEEPKAVEQPLSAFEKASKVAEEGWNRVATEDAAATDAAAAEPTTEQDGSAAKPAEITPPASEKFEASAEQLADTKFWGSLDKAGWERMEKQYPVQTALVKAAQAAGSRIVNEARKTTQQPPAQPANDKPNVATNSPEMKDAIRRANSLDAEEAAQGVKDLTKLAVKELLPELGFNLEAAKEAAVGRTAYALVAESMPEIANLDPQLLDAAVEANPVLQSMYERAKNLPDDLRTAQTADVMRMAVTSVLAKQKADADTKAAEDAKKTEAQRKAQQKVNSNASVVSNVVVDSPAGGAPKGKRTPEEIATSMWPTG